MYSAVAMRNGKHWRLLIVALTLMGWQLARGGAFGGDIESGRALISLALTTALYIGIALVWIGFGARRNWQDALARLGLRRPMKTDWLAGAALGVGLYLAAGVAAKIWLASVGDSLFTQQTAAAKALFDSVNASLLAALLLALLSAIGEETLFRGAIQPAFGIGFTALLFCLIHLQYAFTPGAIIIFGLGIAFGLTRARVSCSAAIIAHATYNLLPFALLRLNLAIA